MTTIQEQSNPPRLIHDAASTLGIRVLKLCELIRAGEIEAEYAQGHTFIRHLEVHRYIAKRAGLSA